MNTTTGNRPPKPPRQEDESTVGRDGVASVARRIADLASTRPGLLTRPWPADEQTVADKIADALPGEARLVTDSVGRAQGWTLLYAEREVAPGELRAELVVDADAESQTVTDAVASLVRRAAVHAPGTGSDSLVLVIDEQNRQLQAALQDAGFALERRFAVEKRQIEETVAELRETVVRSADRGRLEILDWKQVIHRGRTDDVRRLQYLTFKEHWGHLSKTESEWEHYLNGPEFVAEFSGAALDKDSGELVGYVLGAKSRSMTSAGAQATGHTEYIGVSRPHRRRGVAATLLNLVWAAAIEAKLSTASLGVDVENSSNARHLYESLGYRTVGYHAAYRLSNLT